MTSLIDFRDRMSKKAGNLLGPYFKLEKLQITAYTSQNREAKDKKTPVIQVMFNPESYSLKYESVFTKKLTVGETQPAVNYSGSKERELKLKIIFDSTGVDAYIWDNVMSRTYVQPAVDDFLDTTFEMNGDIHQPNFLTLGWGDLIFNCRLASADVRYTLFDNSGRALRAEIDAVFISDEEVTEILKNNNLKSPDMTHSRVIRAGDQLPLLCEQIYGSPYYYLYVARANSLRDFRNLQPGQQIFFPPIEK